MGLLKKIELENGIELNYHRVVSINNITNISSTIEVASYINEKQRNIEKQYQDMQLKNANNDIQTKEELDILNKGINVYIQTEYYELPYDKDLNIDNAYDYLKKMDIYADSKSV